MSPSNYVIVWVTAPELYCTVAIHPDAGHGINSPEGKQ